MTRDEHAIQLTAKQTHSLSQGGLALLVIDQQVDFHPGGTLAIPTANEDSERIAQFIRANTHQISQLVLTLDSHQKLHIAHGVFWTNAQGESPSPFTLISSKDVQDKVWTPRDERLNQYALIYTKALEANGKFTLCIWPEHCIIGTPGHNIVSNVHEAALEWSKTCMKPIQYVMKGSNCFTEHFSALKAEYELDYDPDTKLNIKLINSLQLANHVAVCGEALSHCVNYTVRDLVDAWPQDRLSDITVLMDCSSCVPGFEAMGQQFLDDMQSKGVALTTSTSFEFNRF